MPSELAETTITDVVIPVAAPVFPLPPEIWDSISKHLRVMDLYSLSYTSKECRRIVEHLRVWDKVAKQSKIKKQPGISKFISLEQQHTSICDLCLVVRPPGNKNRVLSIYHQEYDNCVRACLVCRREYFCSFPETLHHKFDDSWFPASDLKKVLKLPPKNIKDINNSKSAPHPNRRSNGEILLYNGFASLKAALDFHGGYVGLFNASSNFKYEFNVSKAIYVFNTPRGISYDDIHNIVKKYGDITDFIKGKSSVQVDIFTNASYDTIIKHINSISINGRTLVAQKRN